jgi:hypothetical protein
MPLSKVSAEAMRTAYQFVGIPMQPPNHNAVQARLLDFERDQIANACLIKPAAVIHNEHVSWPGVPQGLQKYINAAHVTYGQCAASAAHPSLDRCHTRRGAAHRSAHTQASVGKMRCTQAGKALRKFVSTPGSPSLRRSFRWDKAGHGGQRQMR